MSNHNIGIIIVFDYCLVYHGLKIKFLSQQIVNATADFHNINTNNYH